jgi:hypothetical protein
VTHVIAHLYRLSGDNWITEGIPTVARGDNLIIAMIEHFTLSATQGEPNRLSLPLIAHPEHLPPWRGSARNGRIGLFSGRG